MDKDLTHAILIAVFTTIPTAIVTGFFSWKIALGQIGVTNRQVDLTTRQQEHTEEKDEQSHDQVIIDRYKQLAADEKARADELLSQLSLMRARCEKDCHLPPIELEKRLPKTETK